MNLWRNWWQIIGTFHSTKSLGISNFEMPCLPVWGLHDWRSHFPEPLFSIQWFSNGTINRKQLFHSELDTRGVSGLSSCKMYNITPTHHQPRDYTNWNFSHLPAIGKYLLTRFFEYFASKLNRWPHLNWRFTSHRWLCHLFYAIHTCWSQIWPTAIAS